MRACAGTAAIQPVCRAVQACHDVYVDPFEGSLAKLFDAMVAARKQANDLAIAAGASGASTEDLTNIQKAYAAQMAQLTIQLEASAQSLAFSLGLTTQGSLDQINQEIARLQGQIKPATTNVQNFGQAIQQVSQQATSAMNLLLGNLSPLNDQQKLQEALKGLQAGTVTKEQVLQIGRNLYASSEAYTQLFNMVSHMGGGGGGYTPIGGGGNNAAGAAAGSSLSPSDSAKLKELLKEQATLQAAQTLGQYQTLAQQIVEIASAKGEDYMRVLEEMGIQSKDLEKGLGIKSDADLKAYLDKLQKQTDSAGQNTTSIVNAINALPSAIANAIAGKPIATGYTPPGSPSPPIVPGSSPGGPVAGTPPGGSGGGGFAPFRAFSDADAKAFGGQVAAAISPIVKQVLSANPRSMRPVVRL
jgi:cell division septum initiation protein DivIVA